MYHGKIVKLFMKKTRKGFFDPYTPYCFYAGRTFDVPNSLARQFIKEDAAELIEPDEVESIEEPVKIIQKKTKKKELG